MGFFLAGLVVLGGLQRWWLQPLVSGLEPMALFFGAVSLTAITDNAALTYLGAQISGISEAAKYMLVAGAVAGGGLGDFALQYGYQRFNPVVTWITVGVIVLLVQLAQTLGNILARKVLRR